MKVLINSNLFQIVNVGMYNSDLSPENMFNDYDNDNDYQQGDVNFDSEYFWDNFKNDLYVKRIEELCKEYVGSKLDNEQGVVIKMEVGRIYRPKYYNFSTDEIEIEVTYNKNKIKSFISKNRFEFDSFLENNYSSYDGFMSFTSNNYNDWLNDFNDNNVTSIGSVLTYIFCTGEYYETSFSDYVGSQQLNYWEFVDTDKIDSEVETLKKYIQDNYITIDVDTINYDSFEFEVLSVDKCKEIVKKRILDINNNTMSMF